MGRKVIFKALVETGTPSLNGDIISPEAMKQMVEQTKDKPLTFNFNPKARIGTVHSAEETQGGILVNGEFDNSQISSRVMDLFCVPGFSANESDIETIDGVKTIKKISNLHFALTDRPADIHLTPIEIKKEDDGGQ